MRTRNRNRWEKRTTWRNKYPDESAEKYFARTERERVNQTLEWTLILTGVNKMTLQIGNLSVAELAARSESAGLENYYEGYKLGPYVVAMRNVAVVKASSPLMLYSHAVLDAHARPVITGSQEECNRFAEEMNVEYAKHIMVKT